MTWLRALALLSAMSLTTLACVPKHDVQPAPAWKTARGQEALRLDLIQALLTAGSDREALILIAESRTRGDDDPVLLLDQATALLHTGLSEDAAQVLDSYLAKRPRDPRAHRLQGLLLADAHQLDESVVALERAVDLDDSDADTWNNLGFVLLAGGHAPEAVIALRRAVALDGSTLRSRNNLAFALVSAGDTEGALRTFLSTSQPPDAHANLALALERTGDASAALDQYRMALALDPTQSLAREALSRLDVAEENPPPLPGASLQEGAPTEDPTP